MINWIVSHAIYLNYFFLIQLFLLCVVWFLAGDNWGSLYWAGGFLCTAGVTFK